MHEQTVFIIDDDPDVLDSLGLLLVTAGYRTAAYRSAQYFIDDFDRRSSGCLLLDVNLPGMSGLELQQRLRETGINLPTIVMTGQGSIKTAVDAMKNGAVDFLEKPCSGTVLLEKINIVLNLPCRVQASNADTDGFNSKYLSLTDRERDVFTGMVEGLSNKHIARELEISYRTVEVHRANIFRKLGTPNLASLIRTAVDSGLT